MKNMNERLLNALKGEEVDKKPAVSVTQTAIVELMDITGAEWPDAHSDPEKMATLSMASHEQGNLEAIRNPFCLTVLAEALGCGINMGTKNRQPSITDHPYPKDISDLKMPDDLFNTGRIPAVFESSRIIKDKYGDEVPLISGLEGPATLASDLVSPKSFMKWSIKKPDNFDAIMDFATDACIEYANGMVDNGADVICVADPVASPDLLSPNDFDNRIKPRLQRFADEVKAPTVLHICGNVTPIIDMMADTGFDGLSLEEKVKDLKGAKETIGDRASIVGNVSSPFTILGGTPDKVKEDAKKAMDDGVDVLAPGCGIAPNSPLANVQALVDARNEYYS